MIERGFVKEAIGGDGVAAVNDENFILSPYLILQSDWSLLFVKLEMYYWCLLKLKPQILTRCSVPDGTTDSGCSPQF